MDSTGLSPSGTGFGERTLAYTTNRRLRRASLVLIGLMIITAASGRTADAQHASHVSAHTDANHVLLQCAKAFTAIPRRMASAGDSATRAAFAQQQRAYEDSAQIGRACLAQVNVANVADTLLDTLSLVQWRMGLDSASLATLWRLVRSPLPLEKRYHAVAWNVRFLQLNADVLALWRALVPMADSLHDVGESAKERLDVATETRVVDSLAAYHMMDLFATYLTTLDSAGRAAALPSAKWALYALGWWTNEDRTAEAGIGLAGKIVSVYPTNPAILASLHAGAQRITRISETARPFESHYWLNTSADSLLQRLPRGHVTLVEFTTSWCSACKPSYVPLEAMHKELESRGVTMLFVVPGANDAGGGTPAQNDAMLTKYRTLFDHYGITFPVMMAEDSTYSNWYSVAGFPHFVLLDRHGVIRDVWVGWDPAREPEHARKKVEALLAER